MQKCSVAAPPSSSLTALRFLARLVSAAFAVLRYKNLGAIRARRSSDEQIDAAGSFLGLDFVSSFLQAPQYSNRRG